MIPGVIPILQYGTSCHYHRILVPFAQMGYDVSRQADISHAELVVFNRLPACDIEGKKYVLDLDDYWILDRGHYLYNSWNSQGYPAKITELITGAAAVTVTTSLLADRVREINRNVHVIPNSIPFGQGQFTPGPRYIGGPLKFIHAGGASHRPDLELIAPYVQDIDFTLAGYNSGVVEWHTIKQMFPSACVVNEAPIQKYMDCYNGTDVALVPLVGNEFDVCKSNLKILEAGCKGLAVIASKKHPYYNSMDAGFVDYANSAKEWIREIKYMKDNPWYAIERGALLAKHVREHYDMAKANKYREELYKSLI